MASADTAAESTSVLPDPESPAHLRLLLAARLESLQPNLAATVRALDDWHTEVLADFIADADVIAEALDCAPLANEDDGHTCFG